LSYEFGCNRGPDEAPPAPGRPPRTPVRRRSLVGILKVPSHDLHTPLIAAGLSKAHFYASIRRWPRRSRCSSDAAVRRFPNSETSLPSVASCSGRFLTQAPRPSSRARPSPVRGDNRKAASWRLFAGTHRLTATRTRHPQGAHVFGTSNLTVRNRHSPASAEGQRGVALAGRSHRPFRRRGDQNPRGFS